MMIKPESIEALKSVIDIVDVIGSYIELRQSGHTYKAVCPFHSEKTPSFSVSQDKGLFYCFGCHKGGDAIKFVMEYEKLNYHDAIVKIAEFFHFPLQYTHSKAHFDASLLDKVNEFFKKSLKRRNDVLTYINNRHIQHDMCEKFGLGYAPSNDQIMDFLHNNSTIDLNEAQKLGVIKKNHTSYQSRFIHRLIFPIHSPQGKLVGFGGRSLSKDNPAKYLNSPQTILFNKSRLLYGYHLAKTSIDQKQQIIITEGYMDVILLHQAGFTQAVATLGTALTSHHVPLITKNDPEVILAYDGDQAGKTSALKASYLLTQSNGGVVFFPDGMDPADMVAAGKIQALNELFAKPLPFILFVLQEIVARYDLSNPIKKDKAYQEALKFFKTLSPVLQEAHAHSFAHYLDVPEHLIKKTKAVSPKVILKDLKNIAIISTFKLLLEMPDLVDHILDHMDSVCFEGFEEEFELIKQKQFDHPKLLEIAMEDISNIPPIQLEEQLKARLLLIHAKMLRGLCGLTNTRRIAKNGSPPMNPQKRINLIRTLRSKIQELQQGKLVTFEPLEKLMLDDHQ